MESALNLIDKLAGKDSPFKKASLVITVIFVYVFIDLSTGFFTNFFNGQSIDQIQKIEGLLNAKETDVKTRAYLIRVKGEIVSRRDYRQWSSDFLSLIQGATNSAKVHVNIPSGVQINKELSKDSIRLEPWVYYHTFSSGWIFVLIMIALPFTVSIGGKFDATTFISLVVAEIGLSLGIVFFAYIFSVIPIVGTGVLMSLPMRFYI